MRKKKENSRNRFFTQKRRRRSPQRTKKRQNRHWEETGSFSVYLARACCVTRPVPLAFGSAAPDLLAPPVGAAAWAHIAGFALAGRCCGSAPALLASYVRLPSTAPPWALACSITLLLRSPAGGRHNTCPRHRESSPAAPPCARSRRHNARQQRANQEQSCVSKYYMTKVYIALK